MDGVQNEVSGTLVDWRITLWGEAVDAEKAKLLPLPGGGGDDSNSIASTSTANVQTTDLPTTSTDTNKVTENPTDHATRPVNSKPNDSPTQTGLYTLLRILGFV